MATIFNAINTGVNIANSNTFQSIQQYTRPQTTFRFLTSDITDSLAPAKYTPLFSNITLQPGAYTITSNFAVNYSQTTAFRPQIQFVFSEVANNTNVSPNVRNWGGFLIVNAAKATGTTQNLSSRLDEYWASAANNVSTVTTEIIDTSATQTGETLIGQFSLNLSVFNPISIISIGLGHNSTPTFNQTIRQGSFLKIQKLSDSPNTTSSSNWGFIN